jgi:hypothetical protein
MQSLQNNDFDFLSIMLTNHFFVNSLLIYFKNGHFKNVQN